MKSQNPAYNFFQTPFAAESLQLTMNPYLIEDHLYLQINH